MRFFNFFWDGFVEVGRLVIIFGLFLLFLVIFFLLVSCMSLRLLLLTFSSPLVCTNLVYSSSSLTFKSSNGFVIYGVGY